MVLNEQMQWWHCVPYEDDAGANSIICPKSHVASHFNYLDVTNGMVPLMTPLVSYDIDTGINGIT